MHFKGQGSQYLRTGHPFEPFLRMGILYDPEISEEGCIYVRAFVKIYCLHG